MLYSEDTFYNFSLITGFDIKSFMESYVDFNENHKSAIIEYYRSGGTSNKGSFQYLETLIEDATEVIGFFNIHKEDFNNMVYWNLMDQVDSFRQNLQILKTPKFQRSTIGNNYNSPKGEMEITTKQGDTLEKITSSLNFNDPQNEWVSLAVKNNLAEEDYSVDGNYVIRVSFSTSDNFYIRSVVDQLVGERVLGLDADRKITFENDDLKVITYQETLFQDVEILATLKQNDNPLYPQDGLSTKFIAGSNVASLAYGSIFRQMFNTFATDDTLQSFSIRDIKVEPDAVFVDYEVSTKNNNTIQNKFTL